MSNRGLKATATVGKSLRDSSAPWPSQRLSSFGDAPILMPTNSRRLTPEARRHYSDVMQTTLMATSVPTIRENVLRDLRYPVHKIADRLLPYLRVLIEQFRPQQVILFGSYAYGQPKEDSDVDLLIVKDLEQAPVR